MCGGKSLGIKQDQLGRRRETKQIEIFSQKSEIHKYLQIKAKYATRKLYLTNYVYRFLCELET
jgi:hypothetical protein